MQTDFFNMDDEQYKENLEPAELSKDTLLTPFDTAKIDIIVKPMTISKLLDRLQNNELELDPDFQRASNLWDNKRKSRLIESIILKIPLPSFYFNEDNKGNYSVVDGLQRLSAIFQFISSEELSRSIKTKISDLKLTDLQYLTDLNGKTFLEIPRNYRRIINELEITSTIIRPSTPDLVKFNIFARLNQGGLPINGQEIRNSIYPGEWRDYISGLAKSHEFLKYTDHKISTKRLNDHQMILRVISLFATNGSRCEKDILDDFINYSLVNFIIKWSDDEWQDAINSFVRGMKYTKEIFEDYSFRKIDFDKFNKSPLNKTIFEIQVFLLGSKRYSDKQIIKLVNHKYDIVQMTEKEMNNNQKFFESLSTNTGSDYSYYVRKDTFEKIFDFFAE